MRSGMRRDRESGENREDGENRENREDGENRENREDGKELSKVKRSSFYSDSLVLEHVPLRKSSTYRSIVSHVKAFEQVILLVG
jgi:hypothetical protein